MNIFKYRLLRVLTALFVYFGILILIIEFVVPILKGVFASNYGVTKGGLIFILILFLAIDFQFMRLSHFKKNPFQLVALMGFIAIVLASLQTFGIILGGQALAHLIGGQ